MIHAVRRTQEVNHGGVHHLPNKCLDPHFRDQNIVDQGNLFIAARLVTNESLNGGMWNPTMGEPSIVLGWHHDDDDGDEEIHTT